MTRYYCDFCDREITEENNPGGASIHCPSRLGAEKRKNGVTLKVEVIHTLNGVANAGHVCKHCMLDVLYALDDRPKAASGELPRKRGK